MYKVHGWVDTIQHENQIRKVEVKWVSLSQFSKAPQCRETHWSLDVERYKEMQRDWSTFKIRGFHLAHAYWTKIFT